MDIAIIGDEDTVLGFKLTGVKRAAVYESTRAKETVQEFADAKILLVTEKVAVELREKKLLNKPKGVVVEIPDKEGSTGGALADIDRLLEEAIGVKLKDQGEQK